MITKDIAYTVEDKTFTGYLASPAPAAPVPGILLCHQGMGLTEHTRDRARRLAELGYVAFALDMFGEVATSREHVMKLIGDVVGDPPRLRARLRAGLDQLKAQAGVDANRLAAIGFCFGGALVLEAVRATTELACVVAFHPGLSNLPEHDPRPVHGKVLVCAGVHDPLIPAAARERLIGLMNAAGADWQLVTYGNAGHSFTDVSVDAMNLPGFNFHGPTDRRSWAAMRALFDESFAR